MAKIRNGMWSGSLYREVYVDSPDGQIVRSRPHRPWHATNARARTQSNLVMVAGLWRKCKLMGKHKPWERAGRKVGMKGYRLFCQINGALADAGEPLVMEPPKFENIKPNPVGELEILNRGGVITLRLSVPQAPAKFTFVLASPWCGRGIWSRGNKFAIIGRLPPPVRGYSEITDLYVERFGVPPVGQRVFIRTRQMFGSWQDDSKETFADVPPPEGVEAVDS